MGTTVDSFGQIVDDSSNYDSSSDTYWPTNTASSASDNVTENVFDPTYGGRYTAVANPADVNNGGIGNILSSMFGGASGLKTAGALGGALAGALGGTNPNTQRSGYKGSIPQLQAVRNMVTAPPAKSTGYRPGQGGVNWNADVAYVPYGSVGTGVNAALNPAAVAAANAARAAAAAPKPSSTLSNLAKVAGGVGIASLLKDILGGKTGGSGTGTLTNAGIKTLLDKILGGTKTGTTVGGTTGGVTPKGVTGGGGSASSQPVSDEAYPNEELATPEGTEADEFSGIDEQVAANENALAEPDVLTPEEVQAELDSYINPYDESQIDLNDYGLGDVTYDWSSDMSDVDYSGMDYSGFDFGSNDLDLSEFDFAKGGAINMAKGRYLQGDTDGMADKIPAKIGQDQPAALSHGEFVVPADVVSHLGNGNSDAGAKKLYQMMDKIRVARTGNKEQGKKINPDKFMPGGLAQAYANGGSVKHFVTGGETGTTGLAAAANAGITGSETSPNTWAGDYMSNLLGKTQALAESPYQQYMGPLTAGASDLQNKVFTGLQNTAFPTNLGQTFSSTGAYQPPQMNMNAYQTQPIGTGAGAAPTTMTQPQGVTSQGIASQYMNPYLQSVLDPQMAELRRQSQMNLQPGLAKLTQAGGFGGGRQAIMESEANRNLLQEQNKTLGAGYANAFDKAQQQFNTEQGQAKSLADLIAQQGGTQRGIEAEGIAADKAAFEAARQNPYNMLQFQQSMLQGMPISATSYDIAQPSKLVSAAQGATTVNSLLKNLGLV
jgi:hypothetical protein